MKELKEIAGIHDLTIFFRKILGLTQRGVRALIDEESNIAAALLLD